MADGFPNNDGPLHPQQQQSQLIAALNSSPGGHQSNSQVPKREMSHHHPGHAPPGLPPRGYPPQHWYPQNQMGGPGPMRPGPPQMTVRQQLAPYAQQAIRQQSSMQFQQQQQGPGGPGPQGPPGGPQFTSPPQHMMQQPSMVPVRQIITPQGPRPMMQMQARAGMVPQPQPHPSPQHPPPQQQQQQQAPHPPPNQPQPQHMQQQQQAPPPQQLPQTIQHIMTGGALMDRARLDDLVKQIDPSTVLEEGVKDALLEYADEFVEEIIDRVCTLVNRRGNHRLEVRDVEMVLDLVYKMPRVPRAAVHVFGAATAAPRQERLPPAMAHQHRVALIKKNLKKL